MVLTLMLCRKTKQGRRTLPESSYEFQQEHADIRSLLQAGYPQYWQKEDEQEQDRPGSWAHGLMPFYQLEIVNGIKQTALDKAGRL